MSDAVIRCTSGARCTRWFYVWMAGACALIAFGGFAPTYWLQLAPGTFIGSPLLHLHALLFSAWPLFFLLQTTFAALGRVEPSSRVGAPRHLARDRHGVGRLRGCG